MDILNPPLLPPFSLIRLRVCVRVKNGQLTDNVHNTTDCSYFIYPAERAAFLLLLLFFFFLFSNLWRGGFELGRVNLAGVSPIRD